MKKTVAGMVVVVMMAAGLAMAQDAAPAKPAEGAAAKVCCKGTATTNTSCCAKTVVTTNTAACAKSAGGCPMAAAKKAAEEAKAAATK